MARRKEHLGRIQYPQGSFCHVGSQVLPHVTVIGVEFSSDSQELILRQVAFVVIALLVYVLDCEPRRRQMQPAVLVAPQRVSGTGTVSSLGLVLDFAVATARGSTSIPHLENVTGNHTSYPTDYCSVGFRFVGANFGGGVPSSGSLPFFFFRNALHVDNGGLDSQSRKLQRQCQRIQLIELIGAPKELSERPLVSLLVPGGYHMINAWCPVIDVDLKVVQCWWRSAKARIFVAGIPFPDEQGHQLSDRRFGIPRDVQGFSDWSIRFVVVVV
mmetsp:Transcript_5980/g.17011  ORF Transcript_5980/g.17011 Transcript_5980/m.17011 type:complete len:271 (+) Transcript_5980:901-1713(+)